MELDQPFPFSAGGIAWLQRKEHKKNREEFQGTFNPWFCSHKLCFPEVLFAFSMQNHTNAMAII